MSDRRRFLGQLLAAGGFSVAGAYVLWPDEASIPTKITQSSADAPVWPTARPLLEATMDRLLPSWPGSPGASDVGAVRFLESAIEDGFVAPEQAQALTAGAFQLDQHTQSFLGKGFLSASRDERDRTLTEWQSDSRGEIWLRALLTITLEAFFSDPIYGANPGGLTWAWAGIRPPHPRPADG